MVCKNEREKKIFDPNSHKDGGESTDIRGVTVLLHVEETQYHDGSSALKLYVPSIENQRGDVVETWLTGYACSEVRAWHFRRRTIFQEI